MILVLAHLLLFKKLIIIIIIIQLISAYFSMFFACTFLFMSVSVVAHAYATLLVCVSFFGCGSFVPNKKMQLQTPVWLLSRHLYIASFYLFLLQSCKYVVLHYS